MSRLTNWIVIVLTCWLLTCSTIRTETELEGSLLDEDRLVTYSVTVQTTPLEADTARKGRLEFVVSRQNLATKIMSNGVGVIVAGDKKPSLLAHEIIESSEIIAPSFPITLSPSLIQNRVAVGTNIENVNLLSSIQSDPAQFLTYTQLTTFTYLTTLFQGKSTLTSTRREVITNLLTQQELGWKVKQTSLPAVTLSNGFLDPYYHIYTYLTTYTYYNTFKDGVRPAVFTSKETVSNFVTVPVAGQDVYGSPDPEIYADVSLETHTYFRTYTVSKTVRDRITTSKEVVTQIVVTEGPVLNIQPTAALQSEIVKTYLSTSTFLTTITQGYQTAVRKQTSVITEVVTEIVDLDYDGTPVIESSKTEAYEGLNIAHIATTALLTTSTYYTTKMEGNKKIIVTKTTVFPVMPADGIVVEDLGPVMPSMDVVQTTSGSATEKQGFIELGPGLFGILKTMYTTATYFLTLSPGTVSSKTLVLSQVYTETIPADLVLPEVTIEATVPIQTKPEGTQPLYTTVSAYEPSIEPALSIPPASRPPGSNIILDPDYLNSLKQSFVSSHLQTTTTTPSGSSINLDPEYLSSLKESYISSQFATTTATFTGTPSTESSTEKEPITTLEEEASSVEEPETSNDTPEPTTSTSTSSGVSTIVESSATGTSDAQTSTSATVPETSVTVGAAESSSLPAVSESPSSTTASTTTTTTSAPSGGINGGLVSLIGGLGTLGLTALTQGLGGNNFGGLNINLGPMFDAMTGILSNSFIAARRNDSGPQDAVERNAFPHQLPVREPQFIPVGGLAGRRPPALALQEPRLPQNQQGMIPVRMPTDTGIPNNQRLSNGPVQSSLPMPSMPGSPPLNINTRNNQRHPSQRPSNDNAAVNLLQIMTAPPPRRIPAEVVVTGQNKVPVPRPSTILGQHSQNVPVLVPPGAPNTKSVSPNAQQPLRVPVAGPHNTRAPGKFTVPGAPSTQQVVPNKLPISPSSSVIARPPLEPFKGNSNVAMGPHGTPVRIVAVPEGIKPPPGAEGQVFIKPAVAPPAAGFFASKPAAAAQNVPNRGVEQPIPRPHIDRAPVFRFPLFQTVASVVGNNTIVRTNVISSTAFQPMIKPTGIVLPTIPAMPTAVTIANAKISEGESSETSGSMEVVGNILHPGLVPAGAGVHPQLDSSSFVSDEEDSVEYDDDIVQSTPYWDISEEAVRSTSSEVTTTAHTTHYIQVNHFTNGQSGSPSTPLVPRKPNSDEPYTTATNLVTSETSSSNNPKPKIQQDRPLSPTFPPGSPFNPPSSPAIVMQPSNKSPTTRPPTVAPVTKDVQDMEQQNKAVIAGVSGHVGVSHATISSECSRACTANEVCQRTKEGAQCLCRPGYALDQNSSQCKKTFSYQLSLVLERANTSLLRYHSNLSNAASGEYRRLAAAAQTGLRHTIMKSGLAESIATNEITKIKPMPGNVGLIVDFFVQLDEEHDEAVLYKTLRSSLAATNYSLGNTQIYAARFTDSLRVQDFNECINSDYNTCSKHATCVNQKGSYQCQCNPGYVDSSDGTGTICFAELHECEECNRNGRCIYDSDSNEIECLCHDWFAGDQCQVNLKVLMIAIVTSIVIIFLLVAGFVSVCFLRTRRAKGAISSGAFLRYPADSSGITLDRTAIIRGDASSESSGGGTVTGRPTVLSTPRNKKGQAPIAPLYRSPGDGVKIPRAKHQHTPASARRDRSRERDSKRETQLMRYLDKDNVEHEEVQERRRPYTLESGSKTSSSATSHFRTRNGSDVHSYDETTVRADVRRQPRYPHEENGATNMDSL